MGAGSHDAKEDTKEKDGTRASNRERCWGRGERERERGKKIHQNPSSYPRTAVSELTQN
jgi:hypothetical protein